MTTLRWLMLGGFVLMMPPVPLGTELPPLSTWSRLSTFNTSDDCERNREAMRASARQMVTNNPNATSAQLVVALARLQAKCVELVEPAKPAEPPAAKVIEPPAKPVAPPAKP